MNCSCSSPTCRQWGCQANKSPYSQFPQQYLGGIQLQPYAEVTGAMQRLAAAIEKYNENAKPAYIAPDTDPA